MNIVEFMINEYILKEKYELSSQDNKRELFYVVVGFGENTKGQNNIYASNTEKNLLVINQTELGALKSMTLETINVGDILELESHKDERENTLHVNLDEGNITLSDLDYAEKTLYCYEKEGTILNFDD